ncbi:hypothetical protein [Streptosporangium sp. G12]
MEAEPEAAPGWTVDLHGPAGLRMIGPGGALYDGDLQTDPAWRQATTGAGVCLLLGRHRTAPAPSPGEHAGGPDPYE